MHCVGEETDASVSQYRYECCIGAASAVNTASVGAGLLLMVSDSQSSMAPTYVAHSLLFPNVELLLIELRTRTVPKYHVLYGHFFVCLPWKGTPGLMLRSPKAQSETTEVALGLFPRPYFCAYLTHVCENNLEE